MKMIIKFTFYYHMLIQSISKTESAFTVTGKIGIINSKLIITIIIFSCFIHFLSV